jgi:hypothetical protein
MTTMLLVAVSVFAQPPIARDQKQPSEPGTAAIRGRVTAADTGRPLRAAHVTLAATESGREGQTTNTNADGRYEIKDLPAGRYTLSVARSGYLTLKYGQRRPLEQAKPLDVLDRQVIDRADFTLPKMALIGGRITDETGDPIAGVNVFAMRSAFFEGRRRLVPAGVGRAETDDTGRYRLSGLYPGTYYILATTRETWTVNSRGTADVMGFAPTYSPGTTAATDAKRVTVGIGQEILGQDFALIPGRTVKVSGTAFDSHGQPLAGQSVGLSQEFRSAESGGAFFSAGSGLVSADGTFTIRHVPPGEYALQARANGPAAHQEAATVPIFVGAVDVDNVVVVTSAGWSMSGQVITDAGAPPAFAPDRVSVVGRMVVAARNPRQGFGQVKEDWTFSIADIFGAARLSVRLPDEWTVKAIRHEGREIGDAPIEMKSGEQMSGVQIMISDRVTRVAGQVVNGKSAASADGTVIVFSSETEKWFQDSRFVRAARPDQQGAFDVKGLPPGDYLAVAVDYVQDGMWNDPEFLESMWRDAQKLSLVDGRSEAIQLKLVTR